MKYFSTRGHSDFLSFEEAVLQGLSPDGGLYLPEEIPEFELSDIQEMLYCEFHQIAFRLYRPFISVEEVPDNDLEYLCKKSFKTFNHEKVTPIVSLDDNLWVLELFHGPTFAFKDVALQFLGNLFEYFLQRKNKALVKPITVLGATSGDTGGAAIYGLRGKENINVFILHPYKRISPIQELQMTSVLDPNGKAYLISA